MLKKIQKIFLGVPLEGQCNDLVQENFFKAAGVDVAKPNL